MEFLVIGAGGTGACLGAYLADAGQEVSFIARGEHLRAIREKGLRVENTRRGNLIIQANAYTAEEYEGSPDVVFVCVKGYSVEEILPLLQKTTTSSTIVIPVLNIVGTGEQIAKKLPGCTVLDGCIYVSAYISAPGVVVQTGPMMRVVYGERETKINRDRLEQLAAKMRECGIDVVVSEHIARDAFRKYLFLSPFAAAGAYLDATAKTLCCDPQAKQLFLALFEELLGIARAKGFSYETDMADTCIKMLEALPGETTTSLQKDLAKGKNSELEGLVCEPVRLGKALGVPTPVYEKVVKKLCAHR